MARPDDDGLTPRERKFVRSYCSHLSGTLAVKQAGYSGEHPERRAQSLLQMTRIRAAVLREQHEFATIMGLEEQTIARELATVGFSQPDGAPTWAQKIQALQLLLAIVRPDTALPQVSVSQTVIAPLMGTPPEVMQLVEEAMGRPVIEAAPVVNGSSPDREA